MTCFELTQPQKKRDDMILKMYCTKIKYKRNIAQGSDIKVQVFFPVRNVLE